MANPVMLRLKILVPPTEPKLSAAAGFARLVEIMDRLRSPGGCPWDREQTFDTIKPYLLEETYEVMDCHRRARLGRSRGRARRSAAASGVFFANGERSRIFRRGGRDRGHQQQACPPSSARVRRWRGENVGRRHAQMGRDQGDEKERARSRKDFLASVPRSLPALMEARQIAGRAAGAGFDWNNVDEVLEKLREELAELDGARKLVRKMRCKTRSAICCS